jgi:4-amino-4-deoxy-L-arabinose transferase-like glycosyltransferase
MLVIPDGSFMSESLYGCFVALSVLLTLRAMARRTPGAWALAGVAVGLATLTRSDGIALLAFSTVPLALTMGGFTRGRRLLFAGIAAAGALAVLTPWTVRNLQTFDRPVLLSNNQGSVLAGANCEPSYHGQGIGSWEELCFFDASRGTSDEAQLSAFARKRGYRYAQRHLGWVPVVVAARVGRTWGVFRPMSELRAEELESRPFWALAAGWGFYLALLPLAALGARAFRRGGIPLWPLLSLVVMVTVVTAATYGNQRFRMAAEPALVVFAAAALVRWRGLPLAAGELVMADPARR